MVMKYKDFKALSDGKAPLNFEKDASKPAALAHTGGTTGFPKAVLLKDVSFNGVACVYNHYQPLHKGLSYCINTVPPIVVYGYSVGMHMPMCCKAVPAFLIPMLENPKMEGLDMSDLTILGVGGDGCTNAFEADVNSFIQAHGCKTEVVKGYGMTEVGASACTTYPSGYAKGDYPVNALGSVGFPHPVNEFVIWDNENNCARTTANASTTRSVRSACTAPPRCSLTKTSPKRPRISTRSIRTASPGSTPATSVTSTKTAFCSSPAV